MGQPRVIPALLLSNQGLVKTVGFSEPRYVGDPINAVRIFNEKQVDELVFLDITATREDRGPDLDLLNRIASEAFMPFAYGGGITTIEHVQEILSLGVEKVVLNTVAVETPDLIDRAAEVAGSSSVVVSIDARRRRFRGDYRVWTRGGTGKTSLDPIDFAKTVANRGAGEILINAIDRDGRMDGYDLDLIQAVSDAVMIPVVALGGGGSLEDLRRAVERGASAVAAGSMFVFHGPRRAVLITYPDYDRLTELFEDRAS